MLKTTVLTLIRSRELLDRYLDDHPNVIVPRCEHCGSVPVVIKRAHIDREMLTAARARITRVIDNLNETPTDKSANNLQDQPLTT